MEYIVHITGTTDKDLRVDVHTIDPAPEPVDLQEIVSAVFHRLLTEPVRSVDNPPTPPDSKASA